MESRRIVAGSENLMKAQGSARDGEEDGETSEEERDPLIDK